MQLSAPVSSQIRLDSVEVLETGDVFPTNYVTLAYSGNLKNIQGHCILENDTDVNNCRWAEGELPLSYQSEKGDGYKVLSVWVRRRDRVSERVETRLFAIDTTNPVWTAGAVTHASAYNSLEASPSISYSETATDTLALSGYEYAIGTGSGVTNRANIKDWTRVSANPFSVSNLNLVDQTVYYVSLRAVDLAGNISTVHTSSGWTAEAASPAPAFVSISPTSPSSNAAPVIVGTVGAGATNVALYSDASCSVPLGTGTRTDFIGAGITLSVPTNPATATSIYAQSEDSVGALSTCVLMTSYRHDSLGPTVARVYSNNAAGNYTSGGVIVVRVEFNESVTVVGTPTLTLETGSTDTTVNYISGTGSNTLLFQYTVASGDQSGDLDYTTTSALTAGTSIKDAVGNNATLTLVNPGDPTSLAGQEALVIDGVAPAAPSIVLSSPATSPGNDSTPSFTIALTGGGNFLASDVITLHEGADCSATAVATLTSETGTSATLTRGSAMSAGSTSFRVKVSDAAGNSTCSTSHATAGLRVASYEYDNTAPAVPSIALSSPATSPSTDSTPTFSIALTGGGNFAATDIITLHEGADCSAASVATLTSETGSSALITRSSAMSAGSLNFRVKVSDPAGNSSCSTSHATAGLRVATYEYDNTAPAIPSIALSSPSASPGSDSTPTFSIALTGGGNFAATDVITLHEGADCSASAVASITSETGASALITRASAMSAGSTDFRVKVSDAAGNSSCSLAHATAGLRVATYDYDNTAPAAPSIALSSPATSPGNDSTPTFSIALTGGGNFAASDVITLHEGTDCSASAVATLTSETGASALITRGTAMSSGTTSFRVKVTDNAGNGTCSTAHATAGLQVASYEFDNTAPAIPSIALSSPSTSPGIDSTPTFSIALTGGGNFAATDVITLHEGADCSASAVATLTSETGASALLTRGSAMSAGSLDFRVKVSDPAGNSSCSTSHATAGLRVATYEYDNTAPAVPSIALSSPATSPGNDSTPSFSVALTGGGNFAASDVITLHEGADCSAASVASITSETGASATITRSSAMSAGSVAFRVKVSDAAGNSSCSLANATAGLRVATYEYDNAAPAVPSIALSSPASSPGNDSTPTFSIALTGGGNFAATDVITLHEGTDCSAAAVATLTSETGASALLTRGSAMSSGSVNFRVKVSDSAGNSSCSTSHATAGLRVATYEYDNTAPAVPSIALSSPASSPGGDSTPTFSIALTGGGNFAASDTLTLHEGADCSALAVATLTSETGTTALLTRGSAMSAGSADFRVKVSDAAGNSSCSLAHATAGLRVATYEYDNTAPAAPSIVLASPASSPGNDSTPSFTIALTGGGNFAASDVITLHEGTDCSASSVASLTSETGTSATITRSSAMSAGSINFRVKVTDAGGNATCSNDHATAGLRVAAYEYDNTAPAVPSIALSSPSSSPGSDSTPTFSIALTGGGNFAASDVITLHEGADCSASAVATLTSETGASASITRGSAMSVGSLDFRVKVSDAAGNSSCSLAHATAGLRVAAYEYDNAAPAVPSIALSSPASSPGNDSTPSFTVALTGGGNFAASDVITLHEGADCSASSVASITSETGASATITRSSAMSAGSLDFRVKVTDSAGNASCSLAHATAGLRVATYEYDNTAPAVPSIALSSPAASPGSDSTPTFSIALTGGGNFASTDTLTLHEGADCSASAVGTLTSETGTSALLTRRSAMSAGTTNFRVKVSDAAGNSSCSLAHATAGLRVATYEYDNTAPVVPVIAVHGDTPTPGTAASPKFAITLTGAVAYGDGDVVTLFEGGNNTCNGTARGSSTISGAVTTSVAITTDTALSTFGAVNYFAKVTDTASNSTCASVAAAYTYRPAIPTTVARQSPSATPGTDTTPTLRVSGGGVANASTVKLYTDSACTDLVGTATADATPQADVTTSALTAGAYLFYATVTINSTESACSTAAAAYLLDTSAPAAPSIVLSSPSASPGNDSTPTFSIGLTGAVSFDAADVITLHEGTDCSASSVASITSETGASALITRSSAMSSGSTDFRVKVTDEAGNATCSNAHATAGLRVATYDYDNTAPAAPSIALSSPATSPGNDSTPTFTIGLTGGGNFAASDVITLHEGTDCSASSVASLTSETGASALITRGSAMSAGSLNFRVKVTDNAGNATCSTAHATAGLQVATYEYDNTAPAVPSIALSSPAGSPGNDSTPTFTISLSGGGNFAASDVITLHEGADCSASAVGTLTSETGASAAITRGSAMSVGSLDFRVKVSDAAGNSSCSLAHATAGLRVATYEYDNAAPAVPSITLSSPASSPGNDSTPTFTVALTGGGNFAASDVITLHEGADCSAASVASITSETGASATITRSSAMSVGSLDFRVKVTDSAGNASCSLANATAGLRVATYEYDNTAPAVPSIALSSPAASPGNDSTPTFSIALTGGGNFAASDVITLHEGADCSATAVATLTSETGASTSITRGSAMSAGTTSFRVKVSDAAGNSSCSLAHATAGLRVATYEYDNTAPVVPVIAVHGDTPTPGTISSPKFTITLTGAVAFSDTDVVTLIEGGNNTCNGTARGTSTISGGATSSVAITTDTALSAFGAVNYFAKVSDTAGNSSCASAGVAYTYRPAMPATVARHDPAATPGTDATPTIRVTGGGVVNGATVKVYTDSACTDQVGSATADATPKADVTTSILAEDSYLFYATVTINSTESACSSSAAAYVLELGLAASFTLSGVPTNATAGSSFTFTVTARDAGNAVQTAYVGTVEFSSSDPNSPVLPANYTFLPADAGVKQFTATLKTSGNQTITVNQTGGTPTVTTSNIAVAANTATQLAIITGPVNRTATQAFPTMLVRALDAYANTATGYTGDITFAIANNPSAGTLAGTTTVTAVAGAASFPGLSIDKVGTGYTLTASGTASVTSATSSGFNVTAGTLSLAQSVMTISSSSVVSGATRTLTITLKDAGGNQLADATQAANLAITQLATGTSTSTIGAITAVGGNDGVYQATLTGVLAGTANTLQASISSSDFTSTDPSFTVTPGAPSATTSVMVISSSSIASGATATLTITLKDAAGNLSSDATQAGNLSITVLATGTSAGTVGSIAAVGGSDGTYQATFTATTAGTANTIKAQLSSTNFGTTNPSFTVTPGGVSLAQSTLTLTGSPITSGATGTLTITLKDAAGNRVPDATRAGDLAVAVLATGTSTGTVGAISAASGDDGAYTATFTGVLAGTANTLRASLSSSNFTSTNPSFTVVPGAINLGQSVMTISNATITAGVAQTLTITLKDAAGNQVADATKAGDLAITVLATGTSTASVGAIAAVGGNAGAYQASIDGLVAGTANTVKATLSSSDLTSTKPSFTVVAGAVSVTQSVMTISNGTLTAGGTATLTVVLKDAGGNLSSDATQAANLTTTVLATGTSSGTTGAFAAKSGSPGTYEATFTATTAGTINTIRANYSASAFTTTAPSFTTSAGAVSISTSTVASSPTSVTANGSTASTITVTLKDAYSNPVSGKTVSLDSSRGATDTISAASGASTSGGVVTFTVTSTTSGSPAFTATNTTDTLTITQTATVTFVPGAVNVSKSTLTLSANTVASGSGITAKVTARDLYDNVITAGGLTIVFSRSGGTSTGTFGSVSHSLGEYSSTFTGVLAGTATTVSATIGGVTLTSTLPTVSVTPGPPSVSQSLLTRTSATLVSGQTTPVLMTLKDAAGNFITTGGQTILFSHSGGGATGTFDTVVDNGDGTHGATFTAVYSGSATTLNATIGGSAFTGTKPTITVSSAAVDLTNSVITVTSTTIKTGLTGIAALYLRDLNGNPTVGGHTVAFGHSGGTSTLSFASPTDVGAGTYTSVYTAGTVGTATTLTVSVNSTNLTVTMPTVTVLSDNSALAVGIQAKSYIWTTGHSYSTSVEGKFEGAYPSPRSVWVQGTKVYVADELAARISHFDESTPAFNGWVGFLEGIEGLAGTGCTVLSYTGFTPGWCTGGIAGNLTSSPNGIYSPWGMWSDGTELYVAEAEYGRINKYNLSTGALVGWIGRINGTAGLGGATGCSSAANNTFTPGWCTGSLSQRSTVPDGSMSSPTGITGDATYLYIADSSAERIAKHVRSTGAFVGWIGKIATTTGLGGASGCSSAAVGAQTPGWCTGGTSATGTTAGDGSMMSARQLTTDGTNLYLADIDTHRVSKYNASTGAFIGWIGYIATTTGLGGGTGCAAAGVGVTPAWCTGGVAGTSSTAGALNAPVGVSYSSGSIYVVDSYSRINRYDASTGAFTGWIGRVSSTTGLGGAAGCSSTAAGTFTPGWCTGGTASTTVSWETDLETPSFIHATGSNIYVTDYAGKKVLKFNESTGAFVGWSGAKVDNNLTAWNIDLADKYSTVSADDYGLYTPEDVTTDGTYLYVADGNNGRVKRYDLTGAFAGWIGRIGSTSGLGGGAGCSSAAAGTFTPDWCTGGTSASTSNSNSIRMPSGLWIDGTYIYVVDATYNRVNRYAALNGTYGGWIGYIGTQPTGGDAGCSTAAVNTFTPGWCTGGLPTSTTTATGGFDAAHSIWGDGTYLYVSDTRTNRINRYVASTGAFAGWNGKRSAMPTGGDAGCTSLATNAATNAWCIGGSSNNGSLNGQYETPTKMWGDGTYLYINSEYHVQRIVASTGVASGFIGRPTSVVSVSGGPGCRSQTAGDYGMVGWCSGTTATTGTGDGAFTYTRGIWGDGKSLYVGDTSLGRISKFDLATGKFLGWKGLVATTPTGGESGCTSLTRGQKTPGWCTGGTSDRGNTAGAWHNISGIVGLGDYLYTVDRKNHRLVRVPK